MGEINSVLAVAARDLTKFLRDRFRIVASFVFPVIFIGFLGGSLDRNLSGSLGYSLLTFTFTGVFGQVLFQSTASGIISLIQDRESDFSQEIFVSPISRYSIVFGKILGESLIAFAQGAGVIIFSIVVGVDLSLSQLLALIPAGIVSCLLGGAFGMLVLSNLSDQRSANMVFPFLLFPQFFLAGATNPIKDLPPILLVLSRLSPMTYAIDFTRSIFYLGKPEYGRVVLYNPITDFVIAILLFALMLFVGTYLFVRAERNR